MGSLECIFSQYYAWMHVWKIEPIIHTQYTNYIQKLREFNICISKQKVKELRGRKKLLNMKYKLLCHTVFRFYQRCAWNDTSNHKIWSHKWSSQIEGNKSNMLEKEYLSEQSRVHARSAQIIFHVILFSHDRESHIRNT